MSPDLFRRLAFIIGATLALSAPMRAQSAHELFQQALSKERAEGNLTEAIKLYQRVVDTASADHALAAKALLQLGRCYEQLGNTEARNAYERLIARYPDQTEVVAQAKSRLAAMRTPAVREPAVMSVQPVPEIGKDGELLAISPDRLKAIVMDYSKGQNIVLYDFSKKQRRFVTNLDWADGWTYFAVWSPDGRRVAYVQNSNRNDEFEVRVATLDGQSRIVHRSGALPVQPVGWTPDGKTMIVVASRPDRTWAIGTLPDAGGAFTPLRSFGWTYDWRGAPPRLSPDGRLIAYLEGEPGLRDVHVVSVDGRDGYRITDHPGDDFAPIWSPDGRQLAFISNRLGSVALWTVEVRDGKPAAQPAKLKDGMQSVRLIDWTDRGIFFDQTTSTWDVYTATMDPAGRATGSPQPIPYSRMGRNVSPVWSPDGGQLAFVSSTPADPNRRYVVVMPADGGQPREFLIPTTTWEYTQSPYDVRWFGDGRGLGFSGHDTRGAPAVFRLILETGQWDTTPLPREEYRTRTEWNRDGSAFYFARRGGSGGIFERQVNGDTDRPVFRVSGEIVSILELECSPDRKWIGFELNIADSKKLLRRITVVNVATGEGRTVLEEVGDFSAPLRRINFLGWSPSSDPVIWQLGPNGGPPETLVMPLDGSAPRPVTLPPDGAGGSQATIPVPIAKWSPNGRSLAIGRVNRGWETFVIENPLAGTRAPTDARR